MSYQVDELRGTADEPEFLEPAPRCGVLVLTMESSPGLAQRALGAGAAGYVLKEAAETELVEAIRSLLAGRTYLDPALGARLATMAAAAGPAVHGISPAAPEPAVGSVFAGHRVDGVLGRGGMGVVFRATDLTLDRTVALKLIAPEAATDRVVRARFRRESRLAAALDHPHVVQVFHAGQSGGMLYLTMRYVDGEDLGRRLREEGRLAPARAVDLVVQIADALDDAHRLGLVHRDVKPANVLIENRSGLEHSFLTDFGLTKPSTEESVTPTATAVGTADYIAPEQAQASDVDARADVYSLGCMLFRMLTGSLVFDRDTDLKKLWSHVHQPPPRLRSVVPDLSADLERVLDRALAKNPDDRQQSAGELARGALEAVKR